MSPQKTVYVSKEDLPVYEEAIFLTKEICGDSLSKIIIEALRNFIAATKEKNICEDNGEFFHRIVINCLTSDGIDCFRNGYEYISFWGRLLHKLTYKPREKSASNTCEIRCSFYLTKKRQILATWEGLRETLDESGVTKEEGIDYAVMDKKCFSRDVSFGLPIKGCSVTIFNSICIPPREAKMLQKVIYGYKNKLDATFFLDI